MLVVKMANWFLAACVLVTASEVCDITASTGTGSCAAANKGTIAEEIAFVQLTSDVHGRNGFKEASLGKDGEQLSKPEQLPIPEQLLAPMGAVLKRMLSNISGQVFAQKDALCNSIRGEVANPLALWLQGMLKSFTDASEKIADGAMTAGLVAAAAVKESVSKGDLDYVLKEVDKLLGQTTRDATKRMASFAIQIENFRANFTQIMDEMGLHQLAEQISGARVNQTADLVLQTLKTLEEASTGFGNETMNVTEKGLATCRGNIGKWVHSVDALTTVVESAVQDLVMQLQLRLLPVIFMAPPECRGELPDAILGAKQTVTTSTANLKRANLKFHNGMKKALVILTEALEKIKSGQSATENAATKSDKKGKVTKSEEDKSDEKSEEKKDEKSEEKNNEKKGERIDENNDEKKEENKEINKN